MKTLFLYSTRDSVLKHWKSGISRVYELQPYRSLDSLFKALQNKVPDLVLFDYDGVPEDLEEVLKFLHGSKTKVLAFNSNPVYSDGIRLIRNGAAALLNAYAAPNNINQAIKAVLGGNIWLFPEFIQMMIKHNTVASGNEQQLLSGLSDRERELAEMVSLGMSNKEIANVADITEQTVKTHLKTVYEKLGVSSRLELAIMVNNLGR